MRRLAPVLAFAAGLATLPALAQDAEMSAEDKLALHAEIRAYLLEHPEVLVEAMNVLQTREDQAAAQRDLAMLSDNADVIFQNPNDWVGGNPDGDVVLVEFMDYRCGFCRRAHPEVQQLVNGDGKIRYIVKEFPILGEESVAASRFALAVRLVAGDGAYKEVHDRLITARGTMNEETFVRIGEELGLDTDAILVEMQNPEIDRIIAGNHALAQRLEISGTPSFVFQTELVRGYVPLASMQGIVQAIRDGS